jgi:DNA-binding MarR family transcriptional regulator
VAPQPAAQQPDIAILIAAAYRVLTERLDEAMRAAGIEMRPAWGYVVRALAAEPLPLGRLADVLDVTKQAAQQTIDDMVAAGLVVRRKDPGDARRKLLELTPQGRRVRSVADGVSARLEEEVGSLADGLRAGLLALISEHGDLEHVMARRSRAPW